MPTTTVDQPSLFSLSPPLSKMNFLTFMEGSKLMAGFA